MNELNAWFRDIARWKMSFVEDWPPLAVLILASVSLGVAMAIVFRFTSNQRKLRRVAELSRAEVLAIKLFRDDPATMFRALGRLLGHSAKRIWYSLPPMLVMLVPFALMLSYLSLWYEYEPLKVGDVAVVEMQLADDAWTRYQDVTMELPESLVAETLPVRDDRDKTIAWGIAARQSGPAKIYWQFGPDKIGKEVAIATDGNALTMVSARKAGPGFWDRLLYPGEDAFDVASPVRGITIQYERRSTPVFGWDIPWWATLIVVSMLAALVVRPLVKVQF